MRDWVNARPSLPLGNPALKELVAQTGDPELKQALAWSEAVNASIADMVHGVPPFPYVRESLDGAGRRGRHHRVSAPRPARPWSASGRSTTSPGTPASSPGRRWAARRSTSRWPTKGQLPPDHVLMIGDAPGDLQAARANNALFYPINPGHEDESWERFYEEAMGKFLAGDYAGAYEAALIAEFDGCCPTSRPGTSRHCRGAFRPAGGHPMAGLCEHHHDK